MGASRKGKTLSDFPHILSMWDFEKNGFSILVRKNNSPLREVSAGDVSASCMSQIHWKCNKAPDHEWCDTAHNRTRALQSGCPFCDNRKVSVTNSVASLYPEAAAEWHPTKNGEMTAADCVFKNAKKRWWKCKNGHEYNKSPYQRCKLDRRCKKCHSPTSGRKVSDFPQYAALWVHNRNDISPEECAAMSHKKYWWKCPVGDDHYWLAPASEVSTGKYGCAVCSGHQVAPSTSLATLFPDIAEEWHPTKNGDLTPYDVTPGSHQEVCWKCKNNHEWKSSVQTRTKEGARKECKACQLEATCILNHAPELLESWDWDRNQVMPDQVSHSSHQIIAWRCPKCQHKWECPAGWRRYTYSPGNWRFTGCPNCTKGGFHSGEEAFMYLISIRNADDDILFYKIGITNKEPESTRIKQIEKGIRRTQRFSKIRVHVERIIQYDSGRKAKDIENSLLGVEEIRYVAKEKFDGHTELFISNPLDYAIEHGLL